MTLSVRSRDTKLTLEGGTEYLSSGQTYYPKTDIVLRQKTASEGHPFPRLKGTGQDLGGEFYTWREEYRAPHAPLIEAWTTDRYKTWESRFTGRKYASLFISPGRGDDLLASDSYLDALGTTAISRTIPTNPVADTSTFLGELIREGLPSIIGAAATKFDKGLGSSLGSEFLNFTFGWQPLVADLRKLLSAVVDSEKFLTQLRRDSGKMVRRQYYFPVETEEKVLSNVGTLQGFMPWPGWQQFGYEPITYSAASSIKESSTKRKAWFSGAFTYYLDMGDRTHERLIRHAQEAKYLLGLRLTPDVLWNLSPWSWLVDWISNLGDVFHNVSAFADDGLVLRYGYIMESSTYTTRYTVANFVPSAGRGIAKEPVSTTSESVTIIKQRRKATPYGFGLEVDGFDLRQWAILGALGLTKGPNAL